MFLRISFQSAFMYKGYNQVGNGRRKSIRKVIS